MADHPIDLGKHRKRRAQKAAGYQQGMAKYAAPSEDGLAAMVDLANLEDGTSVVALLGPPEFQGVIPDAWRLTADEAERVGRELFAKAEILRRQRNEAVLGSIHVPPGLSGPALREVKQGQEKSDLQAGDDVPPQTDDV